MKIFFLIPLFLTNSVFADEIKVRLNSKMESVLLSGQRVKVAGVTLCAEKVGKCSLQIFRRSDQWSLIAESDKQEFSGKTLKVKGEGLRLGSKPVPGSLELQQNPVGGVDVIAFLPMDDYLIGVVSSEMPSGWPLETLKAQAIAARSYTKATIDERKARSFHLESSVLDQVYRYQDSRGDVSLTKVKQAIRETQGQYLVDSRNQVIKAFYHADCGGETRSALAVWKMSQSYGTAKDPFCETRARSKWKFELSKQDLLIKLQRLSGINLVQFPQFSWATEEKQFHQDILIKDNEKEVLVAANDLRRVIGFEKLRSARFKVLERSDEIEFTGQGFGHGVGLCQWGSWELGKIGMKSTAILKHYFPKAQLKKIY